MPFLKGKVSRMTTKMSSYLTMCVIVVLVFFGAQCCSVKSDGGGERETTTPAESFESIIPNFLTKWSIPGAVVGLVKNEKLIYIGCFGKADKSSSTAPTATSLFRLASISKPITAAAVMKLVEGGLLSLDDKPFTMLDSLRPSSTPAADPRIYDITIRDLLQHSGGFDRGASFDPMFRSSEIAAAMGTPAPANASTIISYMYSRPLDFEPGTKYVYSNFGYCVLGRVIEKVTNRTYEEYVRESVLAPMGITAMRVGKTRRSDALPGEVVYYDYPGASLATSVFPEETSPVEWPYGGFYLEAMDSHGAWLASAVDLLRFLVHIDGRTSVADTLNADSINAMTAKPSLPEYETASSYYGLGWMVRPTNGDANWWHTGSLPGTVTLIVRAYNGLDWVVLLNSRPENADGCISEIDSAMWTAVGNINEWPTTDLFNN